MTTGPARLGNSCRKGSIHGGGREGGVGVRDNNNTRNIGPISCGFFFFFFFFFRCLAIVCARAPITCYMVSAKRVLCLLPVDVGFVVVDSPMRDQGRGKCRPATAVLQTSNRTGVFQTFDEADPPLKKCVVELMGHVLF